MIMGLLIAEHLALFLIKQQQIMAIHGHAHQYAQQLSFGFTIQAAHQTVLPLWFPQLTQMVSKSAQILATIMTGL